MKTIKLIISIIILIYVTNATGQVAINMTGLSPHNSAMLDVSSTTSGILIPRMTFGQRIALTPVRALLVYQTNVVPGFYYHDGTSWQMLINTDNNYYIIDGDNDTKITVEKNSDDDTIRFFTAGTEYFTMQNGRLDILNTGQSVFIGEGAGENDDLSDNQNVFIGIQSGKSNTTGNGNTAIGQMSMWSNTIGTGNTALGLQTLYSDTMGGFNTAIGLQSLYFNTSGNQNTALGYRSLYYNTIGNYNVCLGIEANYHNQEGENNTIIGYKAGRGSTTHSISGNVFIGYNAGYNEINDNKLYIENSTSDTPLIGGDFATDEVYLNGMVGIGTSSPDEQLDVNGGIKLGNTSNTNIGSIRWTGIDFEGYDGSQWHSFTSTIDDDWTVSGNYIYNLYDSIGIGTSSPQAALDVKGHISISNDDLSVYIGKDAGLYQNGSTYTRNVFIGNEAGKNNVSFDNVAIGFRSLYDNNAGAGNVSIGSWTLYNSKGTGNTALGASALKNNVNGQGNIAIGSSAGVFQTGSNSIFIGYRAGAGTAAHSSSGCIFIGYEAGCDETSDNKLYIEASDAATPLIGGDFDSDEIYLNGKVGIGTNTPKLKLHVKGGTDASLANGSGYFIIGDENTTNIVMDDNEIMARDNGAASNLILNALGGNVGVGTTSPQAKLDLSGILGVTLLIDADTDNSDENHNPKFEMRQDGGQVTGAVGFIGESGEIYNNSAANAMYLANNYNSSLHLLTDSIIRMTFTNSGNVGIGVTNPSSGLLQVDAGSSATALFIANPMDVSATDGAINVGNGLFIDDNEIQTTSTLAVNKNNNVSLQLNYGGGDIIFGGNAIPNGHKTKDLGMDLQAWDNVYCDDVVNQGAAAFTDRNVSSEILLYPPKAKTPEMFDAVTGKGLQELDPNSLPPDLREGRSLLTDEIATYNYKANYEQQMQIQALMEKVKELENIILELTKQGNTDK